MSQFGVVQRIVVILSPDQILRRTLDTTIRLGCQANPTGCGDGRGTPPFTLLRERGFLSQTEGPLELETQAELNLPRRAGRRSDLP